MGSPQLCCRPRGVPAWDGSEGPIPWRSGCPLPVMKTNAGLRGASETKLSNVSPPPPSGSLVSVGPTAAHLGPPCLPASQSPCLGRPLHPLPDLTGASRSFRLHPWSWDLGPTLGPRPHLPQSHPPLAPKFLPSGLQDTPDD